ncbi:MAG: hypothetical protein KVP17_001479 [Porospora cf. gigantea B]|uniref:uncharacterized protein n=2 Tax=Porospora cf. gigantea B TaxID=2853592 RepID=UPI003571DF71|nr:MAG: hypothetical protein KVP17_001479 [Porospora cf. gigantea B]
MRLLGLAVPWADCNSKDVASMLPTPKPVTTVFAKVAVNHLWEQGDGSPLRFTSDESWREVMQLRSQSDVLLTSSRTVVQDNPRMTLRHDEQRRCGPLRVASDGRGELLHRSDLHFLNDKCATVLVTCHSGTLQCANNKIHVGVPCTGVHPSPDALLEVAAALAGGQIMLEAGGIFVEA